MWASMRTSRESRHVFSASARTLSLWFVMGTLAALLAAATPGCGGGGDDGDSGEGSSDGLSESQRRRQFVQTIGNGFILPTYAALVEESNVLVGSVSNFCAERTDVNLTAARDQWRVVAGLWMEGELVNVRFGPGHILGEFVRVSWARGEHADTVGIEARIVDGRPPAADERGLEGIEYLLFGHPDGSTSVLDAYEGATGDSRCDYLEAIVSSLHGDVDEILTGCESDAGDYIGIWNTAGEAGNTTYRSVQSVIDALMSRVEFVIDDLVNRKLQRVNWRQREPDFWRSGNTVANILHNMAAAEMLYLGVDRRGDDDTFGLDNYTQQRGGSGQYGMDDYLRETGDSVLDADIRKQFDTTFDALDAIPVSLRQAVVSHEGLVIAAITESRELLRLLKRELAQDRLDMFFEFNSDDGD